MSRKRHAEEKHANNERWLLTYADLITLLLVFFVVMYSISKADESKFKRLSASMQKAFNTMVLQGTDTTAVGGESGPDVGNAVLDSFINIRSGVLKIAGEMGAQDRVSVTLEREGIAISLSGNLLFDSGRAELRQESVKLLDGIAERLRTLPNEVRVEGHTDNIPVGSDQYPTNWELSTARATVVTRYLSEVDGIPPARLSAQGFAEFRPITDNNTKASRSQNRRVDILIIYPTQFEAPVIQ